MDTAAFNSLLDTFGMAGVLLAAVYLVARKLASQYEARIEALEESSARCEADRIELRRLIIERLTRPGPPL